MLNWKKKKISSSNAIEDFPIPLYFKQILSIMILTVSESTFKSLHVVCSLYMYEELKKQHSYNMLRVIVF